VPIEEGVAKAMQYGNPSGRQQHAAVDRFGPIPGGNLDRKATSGKFDEIRHALSSK
jgi:hypothetical protein